MRIADQVIEEVDEQLTIQSMRAPDKRPTAQSLFASPDDRPPTRSAPIDVPASHHNEDQNGYARVQSVMQPEHHPYMFPNNTIFSSSAPEGNTTPIQTPKINVDHFDDLMRRSSKDSDNKEGKIIQFFLNFYIQLFIVDFGFPFSATTEEDVDCTPNSDPTDQNVSTDDHFEQLRIVREKERIERQKQKIARSVSQQHGANFALDSDLILEQLTNSKGDGLNRTSYIDPNA